MGLPTFFFDVYYGEGLLVVMGNQVAKFMSESKQHSRFK